MTTSWINPAIETLSHPSQADAEASLVALFLHLLCNAQFLSPNAHLPTHSRGPIFYPSMHPRIDLDSSAWSNGEKMTGNSPIKNIKKHISDNHTIEREMRVMEAIAAGGSIIAFVQIAASICSGAIDIVKRYKGAPAEFRQVARQLSLLQSELNFIHNLQGEAGDDNLTLLTNETEDLSSALAEAEALILEVRSACAKHKADGKLKAAPRLHWVFHDQSKFKNVVSRLQQVEMSLQPILLLVNMYLAHLFHQREMESH